MKTVNILAIGNSFSRDSTAYLHDLCVNMGIQVHVVNLYIGGCSLERHWSNIEKNERAYQYQENGINTDRAVTISEILHAMPWDFIVTQQASHDSGWLDTYEPFSGLIIDYLRKEVPGAQICIQQTWAYEVDSHHSGFIRYNRDQQQMYKRSRENYCRVAENYGLTLIPSGDVIQNIRKHPEFDVTKGGISICRDGFHMNLYGRYLTACAWLKKLCGVSVRENPFVPEAACGVDEVDEHLMQMVRDVVEEQQR
jgi:hypothetical protein